MLKSSLVFLLLAVIGTSVWGVYCLSEEDKAAITAALKPIVVDCIEECNLDEEDFNKEKRDDLNPCFKKCFLKKIGLLNDAGKYDPEAMREQIILYTDNEDEADKLQNVFDECLKREDEALVNSSDVESRRVDIIYECMKNYKEDAWEFST